MPSVSFYSIFTPLIIKTTNVMYEVSDYLKANCRSWEYDCDNLNDTVTLANLLHDKFPNLPYDTALTYAKDWTGYEEPCIEF